MKETDSYNNRIANMTFTSIYPHYLNKVEKKGRSKEELYQVITWLTGYSDKKLDEFIGNEATLKDFFKNAKINPNAHLIKGVICGSRVEDIKNPLTQKVRYLDKLVDELAKGKQIKTILRNG